VYEIAVLRVAGSDAEDSRPFDAGDAYQRRVRIP
jgi:hypothetical protein